ncbi:MAG TPA: putative solute-binding protein [Polyangia bacterium]|jgi:hypothetical protein
MTRLGTILAAALITLSAAGAHAAPVELTVCVYDPSGANGDAFNMMKDYRTAAAAWGVNLTLKPYTEEKTAAEDFKAQKCHAALLTGVRTRTFVPFSGSIEAMGGLPDYGQLRSVVANLAKPAGAKLMKKGDYETVALFPGGKVYLLVRNRNIKSVGDLAGKRIATLDFDVAAKAMVKAVGASMVIADIGTFAGMFNNGGVDACYAPATAFVPLELRKGIGSAGGVVRYPLAQLTMQLLVRSASFPEGFGGKSREWSAKEFKRMLRLVEKADKSIPAKFWIDVPKPDQEKYDLMFRDVRLRLRDQGVLDRAALKLLMRTRCQGEGAARAECAEKKE